MDRRHEEYKELVASYVLGAIPSDELADVSRHIVSCEECLEEADSYSDVTAALALAVDEAEVPSGFAERVIDQAAGDRSTPSVSKMPARRLRLPSFARVLAGLAATAVVVAAGVILVDARSDLSRNRQVLATLASEEGIELAGQRGATARVVSKADGTAFVATGLDAAPDGHTYQLWFLRDGEPLSAGTFLVEDGEVVHWSERDLEGVDSTAVTIEPSGGSSKPTGKQVLTSA